MQRSRHGCDGASRDVQPHLGDHLGWDSARLQTRSSPKYAPNVCRPQRTWSRLRADDMKASAGERVGGAARVRLRDCPLPQSADYVPDAPARLESLAYVFAVNIW